jgi:hypothetical protein
VAACACAAAAGPVRAAAAPSAGPAPLQLACPAPGTTDPLAVPAGLPVPPPTPVAADPVHAVALQHLQSVADVTDFAAFRARIDCEMRQLVLPGLQARHANLVSLNEYTGLEVFATGERGAAARAVAQTPAGRGALDTGGVPTGAALGLLAAASSYSAALAYYHLPPAGSSSFSVHDLFLAATDTFVRGFLVPLRDVAAKYSALAGGPVYLVGSAPMAVRYHALLQSHTDPGTYAALCLALYADPSQCATAPPDRLYIADEDGAYNVAFVVGPHPADPDHPWIGVQRKVNLVTLEGPSFLDLTPGSMADVQPIAIPGTGVRIGIAISLDAFLRAAPCSNGNPASFMTCLDDRGANVLLQPEANDSLTPAGSWADYIDTSQDTTGGKNPQWQPLTWMNSAWLATTDPAEHFRYAINSFMVGNLLDIAFDGQSAIFQRGGTHCGHYVGDSRFLGPYPSGGPDEAPFQPLAGDKPQFLALAPWVIPDTDRATLRARARALSPNSGSPLENMYRETAVAAELHVDAPLEPAGTCTASATVLRAQSASGASVAVLPLTTAPAGAQWPAPVAALCAALLAIRRRRLEVEPELLQVRGLDHGPHRVHEAPNAPVERRFDVGPDEK